MSQNPSHTPVTVRQHSASMPKLAIEPNSRIYVRLDPLNQKNQPMQGEFVGLVHYEFLVLRLPSVPGLLSKLIPRTMLEVRFLLDGAVNIFTTELVSHSVRPALILFTTYPDRLSIKETRRHQRTTCALPAILNTKQGDARGIISDLSMGGCRITFDLSGQSSLREMAVGDDVVLQTVLNADGIPVGGSAIVRNIESAGTKIYVGLSFSDAHKDFFTLLAGYLELSRNLL